MKGTIQVSDERTVFYLFILVGTRALVGWDFPLKEQAEQIHPNGIPILVFGRFVLKTTKGQSLKQLTIHCRFLPAMLLTRSKFGTGLYCMALAHPPSVAVRLPPILLGTSHLLTDRCSKTAFISILIFVICTFIVQIVLTLR